MMLRHPYGNVFAAQTALAQMETACARAPNEEKYRSALAVAHFRLDKFQKEHFLQALAQLASCNQDQPVTLAFLAMTQHQLGHKAEGEAALTRLRNSLKKAEWAQDQESQSFLAEAETLLQQPADDAKR